MQIDMDKRQIQRYIEDLLDQDSRNIPRELKRMALRETSEYVEKNMFLVNFDFEDRFNLLDYAIKQSSVKNGLWLEFGVYKGRTLKYIAKRIKGTIYGFDSFEGIPGDWRSEYRKGAFALKKVPNMLENISIIKGPFKRTIPDFINKHTNPVAFIHIDCDLYVSTKAIFDSLESKIVNGTIIVFDEFFNYPGWKHHEFKAFMEFIKRTEKEFEYIGYVYKHSQVAVRILS